jgi:hypothetical protein
MTYRMNWLYIYVPSRMRQTMAVFDALNHMLYGVDKPELSSNSVTHNPDMGTPMIWISGQCDGIEALLPAERLQEGVCPYSLETGYVDLKNQY